MCAGATAESAERHEQHTVVADQEYVICAKPTTLRAESYGFTEELTKLPESRLMQLYAVKDQIDNLAEQLEQA